MAGMARNDGIQEGRTVTSPDWTVIPKEIADKHRATAEKTRLRRTRYEERNPGRSHGEPGSTRRILKNEKPFVVWDGEGPQDTGYSLLGNSEGREICYPSLRTADCLDFILESGQDFPAAIHVSFGFNYDVSNILRELPWRCLSALHKFGRTVWRDYELEHIPGKWFRVKCGNVAVRIFDVFSFFSGGLVPVLTEWGIGPWAASYSRDAGSSRIYTEVPDLSTVLNMTERELVETFKNLRSTFLWKDIRQIAVYMRLELKYTKILMEKLRDVFSDAGYLPSSWHGPGSLARMALSRHKVYDSFGELPRDVSIATRYAFAGGRFEAFLGGHAGQEVYCADINSAYPYFCSLLPDLSYGTWERTRRFVPDTFGIYYIRYHAQPDSFRPYPLFRRMANASVVWPYRTEGWYWAPETELVAYDSDAEILEGWIFHEYDPTRKPFGWIPEYYRRRQLLKGLGNPAQYTFKLILNSVYGQLAQRTGWDRNSMSPPRSHYLAYAGAVTSGCRSAVYAVARECAEKLVSIDTDGITSLAPFDFLSHSSGLGGWELSQYDDGIFWQSGIYTLRTGNDWHKARSRGIPKGTYTASDLLECLRTGEPLRLTKKIFTGYGLAVNGRRNDLNTWKDEPHEFAFGGNGKRMHDSRSCNRVCSGGMHRFIMPQMLYGPDGNPVSNPHYLPWMDLSNRQDNGYSRIGRDEEWFNLNDLDEDEQWVRSIAR